MQFFLFKSEVVNIIWKYYAKQMKAAFLIYVFGISEHLLSIICRPLGCLQTNICCIKPESSMIGPNFHFRNFWKGFEITEMSGYG